MRFLLLMMLMCLKIHAIAQSQVVIGSVRDSLSNNLISNFRLSIAGKGDSVVFIPFKILGDTFRSDPINIQISKITVSCVGYSDRNYTNIHLSSLIDLGSINLVREGIELKEVEINLKKNILQMDTLNFSFADSVFHESIMVGETLKLIPGISIVDNKVYYYGELISNILVGGKTFFFGDDNFLLNNLPGFSIENIQIVKPNLKQRKFLPDGPSINFVLKPNSKSGYFANMLGSYGTDHKSASNLFVGRLSPSYQFALVFENNNINENDPLRSNLVKSMFGAYSVTDIKTTLSKDIGKLSINAGFSRENQGIYSSQESSRSDVVNNEIVNTLYVNEAESDIKKRKLSNLINYKFRPNSILTITQNLDLDQNHFNNSTKFNPGRKLEEVIAIDNEVSTLKFENKGVYNFKDLARQSKIINLDFRHAYNDLRYITKKKYNDSVSNSVINEFEYAGSYTYLFNSNEHVLFKVNQSLSTLSQKALVPSESIFYSQKINSLKLLYSNSSKLFDYILSLEMFKFKLNAVNNSDKTNYNALLPNINLDYKPSIGTKYSLTYSKQVNSLTLEQLSAFPLISDFISRNDNFEIFPEDNQLLEVRIERIRDLKKLFLNVGYMLKKDVIESVFINDTEPKIILKNVGSTNSVYVNSRQEIRISSAMDLLGFINYNFAKQNPLDNNQMLISETSSVEANLGFKYDLNRVLEASIFSGLNYNVRSFKNEGNSLNAVSFSSSLKINYQFSSDFKIFANSEFVSFKSNIIEKDTQNTLINLIIQRQFSRKKSFIAFFRCNDLLNQSLRSLQNYYTNLSFQSTKTSGIGRYFLLGLTYKFNTLEK